MSGRRARPALALDAKSGAALVEGAESLGVHLSPTQVAEVDTFLKLLEPWSARFNLLARGDLERGIVQRHLLDSMAAATSIAALGRPMRVVDIGSGAGFPGVPLGIALGPDRMLLVEPRRHRAAFLRAVARELPRLRIDVQEGRVDEAMLSNPGDFDVLTSRASLAFDDLALAARELLRPGGLFVWMAGPNQECPERVPGFGPLVRRSYRTSVGGPEMKLVTLEREDPGRLTTGCST